MGKAPSVKTMARLAGLTERGVRTALRGLDTSGLLVVKRGGGRSKTNGYEVVGSTEPGFRVSERETRNRDSGYDTQNPERRLHKTLNPRSPRRTTEEELTTKRGARRKAAPTDPRVKEFIGRFVKLYEDQMGRAYLVQGGKDGQTIKSLLAWCDQHGNGTDPVERILKAAEAMFADDWSREHGATIGILKSQWNTWTGEPRRRGKSQADIDEAAQRIEAAVAQVYGEKPRQPTSSPHRAPVHLGEVLNNTRRGRT